MSIPNRQIGWSNESNLLWNISKQLEKLNGVVAATAAGGMLNPTTNFIPFNSGLAFGDSYLFNDTDILKTVYNGNDVGLKLDFANNSYQLGNPSDSFCVLGTDTFYVVSKNGGDASIFAQQYNVWIGDQTAAANNTFIFVDDSNQRLEVSNNLKSATAGGSSGQHLKIRVGGVDYKIALLNN